jgi:DNA-binding transcriptional LysR family regulator
VELRQLEYLIAVAEEENFTRAAERVHISQSGVSAQIRQLESDLGAVLIDRTTRRAGLTGAGAAVLGHARAVLAAVDAMRQAVDEVNGLIRGRLTVGMVTACTVQPLFDILAGFHLAHPGIEMLLVEDASDRLVERVRAGEIDLALIGAAGAAPLGLGALPVVSERLVAAVPRHHPLAQTPKASLREIVGYPVICMPSGTGVRAVFDQACAAQSIRPEIAFQASAPGAIADLAARDLGVAILSESMAANYADRLIGVVLDDIELPAVLAFVWAEHDSPALRELIRMCRRKLVPPDAVPLPV